jgi:voltage-gated potassium channel Kch
VGAVLVVALWEAVARAARLGRRSRRRGEVMVVGTLLVAIVALLVDSDPLSAATDLLIAANTLVIGVVIGRALLRERTVTISTLAGALSLYLLIGLLFAQLYQAAQQISGHAFSFAAGSVERFELVYFSFITLTTVGYGDVVPALDTTRALAATEAVTGQLFLVTIVARVIATMGHERPSRFRDTRDP